MPTTKSSKKIWSKIKCSIAASATRAIQLAISSSPNKPVGTSFVAQPIMTSSTIRLPSQVRATPSSVLNRDAEKSSMKTWYRLL